MYNEIKRKIHLMVDCLSVFYKGDNFCDFLFAYLHTKFFLKKCLH